MLLSVKEVRKNFRRGWTSVDAVCGVSLDLDAGESLGLVGESGSGKSTLAKLMLLLLKPDSGHVLFHGKRIDGSGKAPIKKFRRKTQIVFQNPVSSLDPRMTVAASLAEGYHRDGVQGSKKIRGFVESLLVSVDLSPDLAARFPHEISGGECQRVAIARALSRDPEVLICDEPVSSLDLVAQARILNLFLKLQKERGLSLFFISHDLRVVRHLCDRVLVMKDGLICEQGNLSQVFEKPQHPYTRQLLLSSGISQTA